MIPEEECHRGASFVVTAIGKFVVVSVCLAVRARTATAGQMELLRDDVVPDASDGFKLAGIARKRGDISHGAIKIVRANGVTHGFTLFHHRQMVLAVLVALTTNVEKEFRECEPARIAGLAIQFHQADLDFLVSRRDPRFAIAEIAMHQLGAFEADVQQTP